VTFDSKAKRRSYSAQQCAAPATSSTAQQPVRAGSKAS
jgi:hypothetical protein